MKAVGAFLDDDGTGDESAAEQRTATLQEAARQFEKTLDEDVENAVAHYNLSLIYGELGDAEQVEEHRVAHERYKMDDNAADRAVRLAREKYPAANQAAEAVVIYPLQRPGAPEGPAIDGPAEATNVSSENVAPTAEPTPPAETNLSATP